MRKKVLFLVLVTWALASMVPTAAQTPAATQVPAATPPSAASPRAMELADILAWKSMGATALSDDGRWFGYRLSPVEGESEVIIRAIDGDKEYKFAVGVVPSAGAGPAPGGGEGGPPPASLQFSGDGKWAAFTVYPTKAEADRARRQRRPAPSKLRLLDLATGKDTTIENVRRFAFAGERGGWLAIQKNPASAGGGTAGGSGAAPPGGGPGGGAAAERPKGTDLILHDLATGQDLNIGNVAEFAFDKSGRHFAYIIDAPEKAGNGLQLRIMESGVVAVLDSGQATYERLSWTTKGDALAVLKGVDDKAWQDKLYAVIGFTDLAKGQSATRVAYDPKEDKSFPSGMSISPDRSPGWTDGLAALTFGIRELKKKAEPGRPAGGAGGGAPAEGERPAAERPDEAPADEKPDLVIWHYKDPRLQSQQEVEEQRDKRFNYVCVYHVTDKKFVRLADDQVRDVALPDTGYWAVGRNDDPYELTGALEGRRYQDVYAIDMRTGERKPIAKRLRWAYGQSPTGGHFLYYDDGHYYAFDMATGIATNITKAAPVSFVNTEDDHNVVKPPVPPVGWDKTGTVVLLSDRWDVWKVPVDGSAAVNLTGNGRKESIRHLGRIRLDPDEKGIDLSVPQYFNIYGEWTKKGGIARVSPDKSGAESLLWESAGFGRVMKAKHAEVVLYSRETFAEAPEVHATDLSFKAGRKLTDYGAQQKPFTWSAGAMLVDYKGDKGDKLQGALFLPAGYEKGKRYPTLVYIYEKLSQGLNRFATPTANGFSASVYTSNGYAVLMPDITYKVNDPGMSAVWCVLPALKAAVATGIVDPAKVGLQGHSWGGYQTSFLVTQTNAFAAAVAGAPLTNMISMYSLIYKNSGGGNMAIFESSQGRFYGGYWDNWEAYVRNSPVFFAKNVRTPLIILHNDKDGAVDFTQGVEYYNTLRRLGKNVVMLEYVGENHGLRKEANRQDYTVRMKEFFDHYLMGKPAPKWY
ncbi:MAG: prolyl oligopeptidase family serine peptidase, partial [Acidobacteriota bacterium]